MAHIGLAETRQPNRARRANPEGPPCIFLRDPSVSTAPQPACSVPRPDSSTPRPACSAPRSASSLPPPASTVPLPASTAPRSASSPPRSASSVPRSASSVPRSASSVPRPASSSQRPASSVPRSASSVPRPAEISEREQRTLRAPGGFDARSSTPRRSGSSGRCRGSRRSTRRARWRCFAPRRARRPGARGRGCWRSDETAQIRTGRWRSILIRAGLRGGVTDGDGGRGSGRRWVRGWPSGERSRTIDGTKHEGPEVKLRALGRSRMDAVRRQVVSHRSRRSVQLSAGCGWSLFGRFSAGLSGAARSSTSARGVIAGTGTVLIAGPTGVASCAARSLGVTG